MPLYVPHEYVVLNWSDRVGARVYSVEDRADVVRAVAPLVEAEARSQSPLVESGLDWRAEPEPMQETRAYGLVLEGKIKKAITVLGRVASLTPQYDWEQELVDRAAESLFLLRHGRVDELRRRLEGWRQHTMSAMGIQPE